MNIKLFNTAVTTSNSKEGESEKAIAHAKFKQRPFRRIEGKEVTDLGERKFVIEF